MNTGSFFELVVDVFFGTVMFKFKHSRSEWTTVGFGTVC